LFRKFSFLVKCRSLLGRDGAGRPDTRTKSPRLAAAASPSPASIAPRAVSCRLDHDVAHARGADPS